jgi:hypothetical protein
MYTEIEISTIDIRKGGYHVNFTHSKCEDDNSEDIFIKSDVLREHVIDNALNTIQDFPEYGDVHTFQYPTWIEENYEEAIKHYITNKL